jgi:hypothetical protein
MSFHLHVVIDDELRKRLEAHAKKLNGNDRHSRPNLSAAVRDVLRVSMGIDDEDEWERGEAPAARALP